MAPQPACGVCDVDKGRCESGKETKQVAYIHEGTVIACEQSANGKEKKEKNTLSWYPHANACANCIHESYGII